MRQYWKTHSEFRQKGKLRTQKWRTQNKEKARKDGTKYRKEYRKRFPHKHKIQNLLHNNHSAQLGKIESLFKLGGCCAIYFNTHIFELEIHHPFGRKEEPDMMIQVCRKCHLELHHKDNIRTIEYEKEIEIDHKCPNCGHKWTTVEIFPMEIEPPEFEGEPD
jgi:predicted RNA-binding Zn-ribbon protein involved in translation (DUF1610 family)